MTQRRRSQGAIVQRVSSTLASNMFFELEVEGAEHTRVDFERAELGKIVFLRAHHEGGGFRSVRPDYLIDSSGCRDLYLAIMLSGTLRIWQDGHRADVIRGQMALIDSSRSYSIELGDSGTILWVRFPREQVEVRLMSIENHVGRPIPSEGGIPYVAMRTFLACARVAADIEPDNLPLLTTACIEMLVMVLKTSFASHERTTSHSAAATLRRLEQFIEANLFNEDLNLDMIAREQKVSIRYVSKLFQIKGTTTNRFILKRRIDHCRQLLTDPREARRSIKQIAYGCGFSDLSHFNRSFRQICGCTPSEYRVRERDKVLC